jgi:hypothetical protein
MLALPAKANVAKSLMIPHLPRTAATSFELVGTYHCVINHVKEEGLL